jgi:hypothetical protein
MVRRRRAAAVALVACLLLLHLVVPGLARGGHTADAAVTAVLDAVEALGSGAASGPGGEGAGGERAGAENARVQRPGAEKAEAENAGIQRPGAENAGAERPEAEKAGKPCPCGEELSVRQPVARSPRAGGAVRAGAVVGGAPVVDRGGTDVRAAGTGRRPGAVAPAPNAVELQTFRC